MTSKMNPTVKVTLTREEASLISKAIKAQATEVSKVEEWPAILPYTKEDVLVQHQTIVEKFEASGAATPKTRGPRVTKTGTVTTQKNGASHDRASV